MELDGDSARQIPAERSASSVPEQPPEPDNPAASSQSAPVGQASRGVAPAGPSRRIHEKRPPATDAERN
eukprot:9374627-Lingulodinium_polyedra.AAC.1